MPAKPYVQQASSSLQQAVMTVASDEAEMIRRYEHEIQKIKSEISNLDTQRNINAINMASKDDKLQTDVARQQIMEIEKSKSEKEAQIAQLHNEMSQQSHAMQQVKSELQGLAGSVQSVLGHSGLV